MTGICHSDSFKVPAMNISEECKKLNLPYNAIYQRILRGESIEKALSRPVRKNYNFHHQGKNYSLNELCKEFGFDKNFILNQMHVYKSSFEEALFLAHQRKHKLLQNTEKLKINEEPKPKRMTSLSKHEVDVLKLRLLDLRTQKKELNRKYYELRSKLFGYELEARKALLAWFIESKKKITLERREINLKLK